VLPYILTIKGACSALESDESSEGQAQMRESKWRA
jgi:hypothetical protein